MAAEGASEQGGGPQVLSEGPFKGWLSWGLGSDPFESANGPFVFRIDDRRVTCAFQPRREHLNGGGAIHGGALMSFADFSLFAIAWETLAAIHAVTVTFNAEFISAGNLEGVVEARGEVLRETRSMLFVRGLVTQASRPLLAFSGTLKKIGSARGDA